MSNSVVSKPKLTVEIIKTKLETNNEWLVSGLLAIYDGQTSDEKMTLATRHDNGIGFNGCDSKILSSIAQYAQRGINNGIKKDRVLSEKQLVLVRKKMMKYAGQLLKVVKSKSA